MYLKNIAILALALILVSCAAAFTPPEMLGDTNTDKLSLTASLTCYDNGEVLSKVHFLNELNKGSLDVFNPNRSRAVFIEAKDKIFAFVGTKYDALYYLGENNERRMVTQKEVEKSFPDNIDLIIMSCLDVLDQAK